MTPSQFNQSAKHRSQSQKIRACHILFTKASIGRTIILKYKCDCVMYDHFRQTLPSTDFLATNAEVDVNVTTSARIKGSSNNQVG